MAYPTTEQKQKIDRLMADLECAVADVTHATLVHANAKRDMDRAASELSKVRHAIKMALTDATLLTEDSDDDDA
jgi:hypothetical protein